MPRVYLENEACIQSRLLFEIGFNTRHYDTDVVYVVREHGLSTYQARRKVLYFPECNKLHFEHSNFNQKNGGVACTLMIKLTLINRVNRETT